MEFSLMTYTVAPSWPGGLQTLEQMADFAGELGFEALELSAGNLGERSAGEFARLCGERGLAVSCLNGSCNLAASDDGEFNRGVDRARTYVDMAAEMACPVVMLIPGFAASEADKPRAAARIADGLRTVVAYGADKAVVISLEDFPNLLAPYGTIAEMGGMLEHVPGLRLTFDNGNWLIHGDDPLQALKTLGAAVVNVHVKDWEPDPEHSRLQRSDGTWVRGGRHGKGLIDHQPILAELKAQGYGGYLAFEYEGPLDHARATREGLAYLRDVLATI